MGETYKNIHFHINLNFLFLGVLRNIIASVSGWFSRGESVKVIGLTRAASQMGELYTLDNDWARNDM